MSNASVRNVDVVVYNATQHKCYECHMEMERGSKDSSKRRYSTIRDALEVLRSLYKNQPEVSVATTICVTKHQSAKPYNHTFEEASLPVVYKTFLRNSGHF
ncbi:hypothetical protein HZH66_001840 [Vespula vulgaris]|uniref:Uncharacterized protein n=2 Tax=Vespula TaxID=7451 RepID=A0A834KIQ0_VESVU|nr:hypothetical protein HZH66_001840 [Vespula vulgaris]